MFDNSDDQAGVVLPEAKLPQEPLTIKTLDEAIADRLTVINKEFSDGLDFIKSYDRSVTFFGSSRFLPENPYYLKASELATRLTELGYAVVTGGGPGIMEAANRGAFEAGGRSLGLAIHLPREQAVNKYLTGQVEFNYFFSRKVCLSFSADAFVFFPGGFGTLDEFFEIVTLIQTHKMPKVPVILCGRAFWQPLLEFIDQKLYQENQAVDKDDLGLYSLIEEPAEAIEIVKDLSLGV